MNPAAISIIIATRNREPILWTTVAKAVEGIEGSDAEIIVVNDGDRALSVPPTFSEKVVFLDNGRRGVSAARNLGALHARGTVLFFIDDDMWIHRKGIDWIFEHMVYHTGPPAVYNINWEYPLTLQEKLKNKKIGAYILSTRYNTMWGRMHVPGPAPASGLYPFHVIASCSLVVSRELFRQIGGYNESILFQGEDIELTNRIRRLSIPVFCVFDVTLFHNHEDRLDFKGFLERVSNGYRSQYSAEMAGLVPVLKNNYRKPRAYIYEIFLFSEKIWIGLYKLLPNNSLFEPLVNRLVGALSGLEKYRQWKTIYFRSGKKERNGKTNDTDHH